MPIEIEPFCFNPKCSLHQYRIAEANERMQLDFQDPIARSFFKVTILRHLYHNNDGQKVFFCDICDSAIQQIQTA